MSELETFPDWDRALAVVAHPDDMEYGAAAAVARWTAQGKWVGYVLVTEGEAGISTTAPEEVAPILPAVGRRSRRRADGGGARHHVRGHRLTTGRSVATSCAIPVGRYPSVGRV